MALLLPIGIDESTGQQKVAASGDIMFGTIYTISLSHAGTLPLGGTWYFTPSGLQNTHVTTLIGERACKIIDFRMRAITSNGAAHTDTYTVVLNGTPTAMSFAVTNAAIGNTQASPVTMAVNDLLSIQVVTDGATQGADVAVQVTVQYI